MTIWSPKSYLRSFINFACREIHFEFYEPMMVIKGIFKIENPRNHLGVKSGIRVLEINPRNHLGVKSVFEKVHGSMGESLLNHQGHAPMIQRKSKRLKVLKKGKVGRQIQMPNFTE